DVAEMAFEIGDGTPADDRQSPLQPRLEPLQQRRQRLGNPDQVRRVRELDQRAVEIEEQRGAGEIEGRWCVRAGGHARRMTRRAPNLNRRLEEERLVARALG